MERREKERKEKTKIDFVTGVKKPAEGGKANERRTKWDTQPQTLKKTESLPANVSSAATGTKTTVISALGSLKKTKS